MFWDSSALVALLVPERSSAVVRTLYDSDEEIAVWWASLVECASALARVVRMGTLAADAAIDARERLSALSRTWYEIAPASWIRDVAIGLLDAHALRAADALQLAAAIVVAGEDRGDLSFVCLDDRLIVAAREEGLRVIP